MSIATAIQNAQTKVAAAYTSCNNKGATMPSAANQNLSNLASTIDSIVTDIPGNQCIEKWIKTDTGGTITYTREEQVIGNTTQITSNNIGNTTGLVSCLIPDTIRTIAGVFQYNTTLEYVNIENVTALEGFGFRGCTALTFAKIPLNMTSLPWYCFSSCTSLRYIDGLERLTSLSSSTFENTTNLAMDINMPNLTTINSSQFQSSGITSISSLGSITSIPGSFARRAQSLKTVVIPSTVTSTGTYIFNACSALESVTGLESIEYLGADAFSNCSKLAIEVNMPNLISIGVSAFGTSGITKITSLGSITSIPSSLCRFCSSLSEITLPSTLTALGSYSFNNCASLTSLTILATTPPTYGTNAIANNTNLVIYVPAASVADYQAATGWSAFASKIQAIP